MFVQTNDINAGSDFPCDY